jgi:hypothetical protein
MRPWVAEEGQIALPTTPGLGIDIDAREAERHREYVEELGGAFRHPSDRSVADW